MAIGEAIDKPIDSHPRPDPTGTKITDRDGKGVFIAHVKDREVERIAEYRERFDMSHKGTHPHWVWNHASTQFLHNSAETGQGDLYCVDLSGRSS
jgi:hypothetical protein